jgi:PAS domain S-box-containing protein
MKSAKVVGWDWDVKSGRDIWFGDLQTMFGIAADTYTGKVEDFRRRVHPDDRELVWRAVADARQSRSAYVSTFRLLREDGTVRWVSANGQFYYADNGEPVRMLGIAHDITERTLTEEARRESEGRFQLMADAAAVMLWMTGPDKLCNYLNRSWLDFTGRSKDDELGDGWMETVHPDDLNNCWGTYAGAFDRREPFRMECRVRRHDGVYRWVLCTGVPRLTASGEFVGYVGSSIDITEHKLATDGLAGLSRKLMEAHESERTRIAKELHDDVGQRMALFTMELERLGQMFSHQRPTAELGICVRELCSRAIDLEKSIQAISHRLHSSKLEFIGITVAAAAFCRELCKLRQVEIDFHHEGIPRNLPKEIALCLFRVLQEALNNAVKHAGVSHFTVALAARRGELQLEVADKGTGFDIESAIGSHALGIIGMKERLSLVKGRLLIDSQRGVGTTLRARVPLGQGPWEILDPERARFHAVEQTDPA